MQYFTNLFLLITVLWWILLLVSIFISPPGMHSRGSGFTDFSFTTLTVGNLLVGILFFLTPSKAAQVSCLTISVLLMMDAIIVVATPQVRLEEGWPGIASVLWAFLIATWLVVQDRVVASGKASEEERLTGRPESRRTLKEWLGVLFSEIFLIAYIVIIVLLSATLILRVRDSSLAAPGEKYGVDGNKYQVHLFCKGEPIDAAGKKVMTVFVEAGEGPSEESFAPFIDNALKNGTISRYCLWDRPGFAWSENAPSPLSAGTTADALTEALARAGEEGPYILVSAGVGSIYSRVFAARRPAEVKGLLMIDPLHEELLYRLAKPAAGFTLWFRGVISPLGIERLPGALFKGRTREDRLYGRNAYQSGRFIKAKLQENLVADSLTKSDVNTARAIQSRDTPLVVVSSGVEVKRSDEWASKQRDLTHVTDNLMDWTVVKKAPHEVWMTLEGRKVIEEQLGKMYRSVS